MIDDDETDTETGTADTEPTAIEAELDGVIADMTGAGSDMERLLAWPRAKKLYLRLHPETAPGQGQSKARQSAKSAPCYAVYMAKRVGRSRRYVENRLKAAEELATLAPQARAACRDYPIANDIGVLVRVARIPDPAAQLLVVDACREHGLSRAKVVLKNLEEELGLRVIKVPKQETESAESETESAEAETAEQHSGGADPGERVPPHIMAALGARSSAECLGAIEGLKRTVEQQQAEIGRLREELAARAA